MIVCKECGNAAESADGFCSSCGVLLEWSGQHVDVPAGTVSSTPGGTMGGMPGAMPGGTLNGAVHGRQRHEAGQPDAEPTRPAPEVGQPDAEPTRPGPKSRKPVAERNRPGPVPLAAEPVYTGPYCSACGVRNPEGRTFCRSCGERLRVAFVPEPAVGWWRRLFARLRGQRGYEAGDRPRGFVSHDTMPARPTAASGPTAPAPGAAAPGTPGVGAPRLAPPASGGPKAGQPKLGVPKAGLPHPGLPHPRLPKAGVAKSDPPKWAAPAASTHRADGLSGTPRQPAHRVRSSRRVALSRFGPLLVVAGLVGMGLGPARGWITSHLFGLENNVHSHLSQRYVDQVPISAAASSSAPGHRAKLAIDGISQTYWLTRGAGSGSGARLTVTFASPVKIDRVGVLSGEPGAAYRAQARPQAIELVAGNHRPVELSFDDTPAFQNRALSLPGVTSIEVTIKSVYAGQQGQAVALRELEFFTRV